MTLVSFACKYSYALVLGVVLTISGYAVTDWTFYACAIPILLTVHLRDLA